MEMIVFLCAKMAIIKRKRKGKIGIKALIDF